MTKPLTVALVAGDLPAAAALLDQNVVFHSPVLATTGDEIRGPAIVAKILQTVFACPATSRNSKILTDGTSSPSTAALAAT